MPKRSFLGRSFVKAKTAFSCSGLSIAIGATLAIFLQKVQQFVTLSIVEVLYLCFILIRILHFIGSKNVDFKDFYSNKLIYATRKTKLIFYENLKPTNFYVLF